MLSDLYMYSCDSAMCTVYLHHMTETMFNITNKLIVTIFKP